jgi:hypothetical protein
MDRTITRGFERVGLFLFVLSAMKGHSIHPLEDVEIRHLLETKSHSHQHSSCQHIALGFSSLHNCED